MEQHMLFKRIKSQSSIGWLVHKIKHQLIDPIKWTIQSNKLKTLLKFWKIPLVLDDYEYACLNANNHIQRLEKLVQKRDLAIERLIKDFGDDEGIYHQHYIEDLEDIHGDPQFEIPTKYLTDEEFKIRMGQQYERSMEASCGCYATEFDEFKSVLSDLEEGGFYDK
jgi:hypothetical protein